MDTSPTRLLVATLLPAALLLATLAVSERAFADHAKPGIAARDLQIEASLSAGRRAFAVLERTKSLTGRLRLLDRVLDPVREAREHALAIDDVGEHAPRTPLVEAVLVRLLNKATAYALERGSLPRARALNHEALQLKIVSLEALLLFTDIHERLAADIYDDLGTAGINRVRSNRAGTNLAVRDRGIARRR